LAFRSSGRAFALALTASFGVAFDFGLRCEFAAALAFAGASGIASAFALAFAGAPAFGFTLGIHDFSGAGAVALAVAGPYASARASAGAGPFAIDRRGGGPFAAERALTGALALDTQLSAFAARLDAPGIAGPVDGATGLALQLSFGRHFALAGNDLEREPRIERRLDDSRRLGALVLQIIFGQRVVRIVVAGEAGAGNAEVRLHVGCHRLESVDRRIE